MTARHVPQVRAATGTRPSLPVLGQGTWEMGVDAARRADEVAALRLGLDLGLTLIDTAEMYADGGAEEVVGEAIRGRRDDVYLVSKVLPENASRRGTVAAAERSLRRLGTDRMDLYLLHWEGGHPLEDTLAAFEELRDAGRIVDYGVSNFPVRSMEACFAAPGGRGVVTNQVYYNLGHRWIETRLQPWCRERGVVVMAFSPLDQGRLGNDAALARVAERHGATPHQVALAWVLRDGDVVAVVKSANPAHLRADAAALDLRLTPEDLAEIDRAHPAPTREIDLDWL